VPLGISYDSDIDKARVILLDLASKHPKAKEVCGCPLTQLGNFGMVLTLEVWCADALTATALRCDLLEQATKRFARDGIGIPLPQTTVVLKDDRRFNCKQEQDSPDKMIAKPIKSPAGVNTP
jgi:small-conductance mechanosensitive channel